MEFALIALHYWWAPLVLLAAIMYKRVGRLFGVVFVPDDALGIVNKKFVLWGDNKSLPDGAIIALNGEPGIQADTLAPGVHFGYWPWQYEITLEKFITVPEGTMGIVEARDGKAIPQGRVLARKVESNTYQDARAFLTGGGERGPQLAIIPPGTYRINTGIFSVGGAKALDVPDDKVGVVTTKEGKPLRTGEIAGPEVSGHSMYQDPQAFVDNGGWKGMQEQVILAGRYYVNPRFATVELVPMTQVPIANAGVVISYVGEAGQDVTGESFRQGNLVPKGQRGVWITPLDPGKYPINPYTHKLENVPTANVVLNWADGKTEAHNLDKNLSTITVRSSDGFTFNLDVSQIIHVPRNDAPKVIARFGSMANLVTQVLEPTIGNYFRNAAQGSDVIAFLAERRQRQDDAKAKIAAALKEYDVSAVDTLIGDITPPAALMKTLTDRKIAEQEKITYGTQRLSEETRKELQQAKALADTQARVVDAERSVSISEYAAQAAVKKAEGEAKSKTLVAEADAMVLRTVGDAEAAKARAVGTAEADVIQLKIKSVESDNYAAIEIAKALAGSGFKLVPDITVAGQGGGSAGGTLIDVLLGSMIRDAQAQAAKQAGDKKHVLAERIMAAQPAAATPPAVPTTK